MLSRCCVSLSVCVVLACFSLHADVIEVEGTVKDINAEERTVTLTRTRGKAEKVIELEVAEKADIKAGDSDVDLADIKEGDEVAVKYDSALEIVTELVKGGADEKTYAKLVRSKFAASKATFDPKSGVLTLMYDFAKPSQLKDFEVRDAPSFVSKGLLRVPAAETLTHIVEFTEGSIGGRFAYGNLEGNQPLMHVTGAAQLRLDHVSGGTANNLFIQLHSDGEMRARKDIGLRTPLAIQWDVTPNKVRVVVDGKELAAARGKPQDTGRFLLHGGNGGLTASGVTISGKPKEEWFKAFLDK